MKGYLQSAEGIECLHSEQIDALFSSLDKPGSPGANLAVIQSGEVIHQRGYGVANIENDVAFTRDTVLRLGSTSKHLCATCILILRSRNLLTLDDDIREHLPGLPHLAATITINHLLTMTSGIKDGLNMLLFTGQGTDCSVSQEQLIKYFEDDPRLMFEPGSDCSYCNTNYALISKIIENVSGETLTRFMQHELFSPLSMQQSRLVPKLLTTIPQAARGYIPLADGQYAEGLMGIELAGDGGVVSTLGDMLRWFDNYRDDQLLGGDLRRQLEMENRFPDGQLSDYRLGMTVTASDGKTRVSHAGGMPGFLCDFVFYPESDLGIVLLTNVMRPELLETSAHIARIVHGPTNPVKTTTKAAKPLHEGCFANLQRGLVFEITREQNLPIVYFLGERHPLEAGGEGLYISTKTASPLTFRTAGRRSIQMQMGAAGFLDFKLVEPLQPGAEEDYSGIFHNDPLNEDHRVTYTDTHIVVELIAPFRQLVWHEFRYVGGDLFTSIIADEPSCTNVQILFMRDEQKNITGFSYNLSRCLGVEFAKVPEDTPS